MSSGPEPDPPPEPTTLTLGGGAEPAPEKKSIGPYQVVRKMGQGGMGAVYLGVRVDQEFKKHVAIKVIRTGLDSEEVVARFRRERQILASLDHPHIAHLIDAGTTDDGLPYFVMEYVQGRPLTDYCDSHKLTVRERLELFRSVCSAVQQAHQNLVVHRDLKPANILVTADGKAKLLDFGIAKLLNPDAYPGELPPTATDMRVMTPDYASPEQVRGDPIGTSSDVYSLGVILYELLSGRRPYRFKGSSQAEVFRVISEQEPRRPSTAITAEPSADTDKLGTLRGGTAERLQKELRGDLDNIVLMALRKEPQRRYASAEAFSEDVRRYLDGHPVAASKGTWSYRAQKYVRRHKAAVAAATLVALLLVAFSIVVSIQNVRIASERDAARTAEQKAVAVTDFLVNLFETNDPARSKGETLTARQILDKGALKLQAEFKGQPEVQAQLMNEVGLLYEKLGVLDQAERLFRQALTTRRSLFGPSHVAVAESLQGLGVVLMDEGRYADAEPVLRDALAMHRELLGSEHAEVADDLDNLGLVLHYKGQSDEAEKCFREAVAMHRKLLGSEHPVVAGDLNNLALALQAKGEFDEAEKVYREALAMSRRLTGDEHPEVALELTNLAGVLQDKGQLPEAEALLREALAIGRKLLGNEHPDVAASLNNLANVLRDEGQLDEAEALFRESLAIGRKLFGNQHPGVATALTNLALVLRGKGQLDEAEQLLREGLAIHRTLVGNQHPKTTSDLNNLAAVLREKGQLDEAETLYREALASNRSLHGNEHPDVALNLTNLASVQHGKGELAAAESTYREALALHRKLLGRDHPYVAATLAGLSEVLLSSGKTREAEASAEEVLAFPEGKLPLDSKFRARAKSALAGALLVGKDYTRAEPLLLEAYRVLSVQEKTSIQCRQCLRRIMTLYEAWGKPAQLAEYRKLAFAVR